MAEGVVLITGGARGIGKEVARQLADDGLTVYIGARDPTAATGAANDLAAAGDVRPLAVGLDVASQADVDAAAELFARDPGRLDVLINNAAAYVDWGEMGSSADLDTAHQVVETNLFGAWRMVQASSRSCARRRSSSARGFRTTARAEGSSATASHCRGRRAPPPMRDGRMLAPNKPPGCSMVDRGRYSHQK